MRSPFTALLAALLWALPAAGQAPGDAAFLKQTEALRNKLSAWQVTLNKMNFVAPAPQGLQSSSLEVKRSTCLLWITTTSGAIPGPGRLPTMSMQVGLLNDLTFLDDGLASLIHALELVRATRPPGAEPSAVELEQEQQVKRIRKELQGFYRPLSSETFQQLQAVDRARAAGERPLSHQPGQISGHIYQAGTGQPLAHVIVTLESSQSPENDQLRRTPEDGRYAFTNLAPGRYWVVAYRKGFAGSVYGMDASQNVWECTISLSPGQKLENADLRLTPVPSITAMNEDALRSAIPGHEPPIVYGPGRFSPGGTRFAVAASEPGSEYVCVYGMASHKLEYVATVPQQGKWDFTLRYLTWAGDSLYAQMEQGLPGALVPFRVTAAGMQRADVPPACASLPPGRPCITRRGTFPAPLPPEIQGAYLRQTARAVGVAANSHFILTAEDFNNVQVRLRVQTSDGQDSYRIATGGKELKAFLFDPDRSVVFYPVPGRYFGGIVAYDLNTRQAQNVALPFTEGLRLLDSKRDGGGTRVAYAVDGPCAPQESPDGEDPWILPNKALLAPLPPNVCFAEIADKT
jgi:hypothetical protein